MKYDKLLKKCSMYCKLSLALDEEDLARQALTNPEAWSALTDYLLESGKILTPEVPSEYANEERFREASIEKVKAEVARWVMRTLGSPNYVKASDIKPGDIVVVKELFGDAFHIVRNTKIVEKYPEDMAPGIPKDDPWYEQYRKCLIEFTSGKSIEPSASTHIRAYRP